MTDDTVYEVVDNLDTHTGPGSSSFYERGSVYQNIDLSNTILDEVRVEATRVEAIVDSIDADAASALVSRNAALASAAAALISQNAAAASAAASLASENAAASSAASAAVSVTAAEASASTATAQAVIATTQAGIATAQAVIATTQAGIATAQATNASTSASAALVSQNAASVSAAAAAASAAAALVSQNAAAASATSATGSATAAGTSATNASSSAASASGSATTATTQASNSSSSATASATSATAASTSLTTFRGIFYGAFASDPTLDPNGASVNAGDLYYNTSASELRVYSGSLWASAAGAGLSDEVRHNLILTSIRIAKALGAVQGVVNGMTDGFGGTDGVNAGASSNYTSDISNKRIINGLTSDVWSTAVTFTMTADSGGWTTENIRCHVAASNFSTMTGTKVRFTLAAPAAVGMNFSNMGFGHKGVAALDYDASQAAVTFGGAANLVLAAAGADVVSDPISYNFDSTKDLLYAFKINSGSTNVRTYVDTATTSFNYKSSGGNETVTTAGSGYTAGSVGGLGVKKIEVLTALGGSPQNMTVVGSAFSQADAVPSTIKVSAVIEAVDAAALNTDATFEVSRDGGTTWAAASVVAYHTLGTKTYVESTDISVTTQPSGTTPTWRYKTFNTKRVYLHGVKLGWA